jgi:hypothetical protein
MPDPEFTHIDNFEEIIVLGKNLVAASDKDYRLNFSIKVAFGVDLLKTPQLLDAAERAEDFQKIERPESLYLNHGEYITAEGIPHVINELKNKDTGNRALISLINQKDIIGSGDTPIPSFMVLQFSLEGDQLYITTYFRALEVSKFLRINLEEIRLVAKLIVDSNRKIKGIKLNVFSFRAYVRDDFNPLERPAIELLDDIEILKLMEKKPKEICRLLREKLKASTVIENNSLTVMNQIITDDNKNQDLNACFKIGPTKRKLQRCLDLSSQLIDMRKSASHAPDLEDVNNHYMAALTDLIEEIEECE